MSSGLVSNGCVSTPFELLGYEPELDQRLRTRPEVKKWCENAEVFVAGKKLAEYNRTNIVGLARGLAKIIGKETTLDRSGELARVIDLKAYCEAPGAKERLAADPNVQLLSLTLDGQFSAADADLAHVYSTGLSITEDTKMVAPLALAQDLFQSQNVSYFGVYLNDQTLAPKKAEQIASELAKSGLKADVYSWTDIKINPYYVGTMSFLYTIGLFFAVLIFSVVSLSVINLTTMNILDRSREIGTLKALGFNQRTVSWIFLLESAVIAASGCLAGLTLGWVAAETINSAKIKFIPPGAADAVTLLIVPDALVTTTIVIFTFLLVTLSSFITCYRLSRRSCLDLLTKT
ncbi:MAG: ABC transporter permease [Proteobacteria bacterium]|nr:MAG: ABC transporter permease [Pseudomonadota bacterium]